MLIIDLIASFFLKFSHNNIIIPLFFFAYIYLDKKLFFKAAIILLSSVLLNYILKNIFQVPLYPWLGQGYAFPSGHMQSTAVLYGFLWLNIKNSKIRTILPIIIFCVGMSLIYFKYHDLKDILGALFVSSLILYGSNYLINKGEKIFSLCMFIFNNLFMLIILINYPIHFWIWGAYYASLGLFLSYKFSNYEIKATYRVKTISTAVIILFIFIIEILTFKHYFLNSAIFIQEMRWGLMSFLLAFLNFYITQYFYYKRNFQLIYKNTKYCNQ